MGFYEDERAKENNNIISFYDKVKKVFETGKTLREEKEEKKTQSAIKKINKEVLKIAKKGHYEAIVFVKYHYKGKYGLNPGPHIFAIKNHYIKQGFFCEIVSGCGGWNFHLKWEEQKEGR